MNPTISLIVAVYNRAHYLAVTIESILAQTRSDFELLIWDDGSTDQSLVVAHEYARRDSRIRVMAGCHQGFTRSLKDAIAVSTGSYIGWVDSDDWLAPTALARTAEVLDEKLDVGLVYTDHQVMDAQGKELGLGSSCKIPYSPIQLLVDFMVFHFRLMRRTVYDQVGGVEATFERAQDYDLCLKLSEVTTIHHLQQPLYHYRRHTGNLTNGQLEQVQWTLRASTQALQRRGLDQHYEIGLRVVSEFSLQRKVVETDDHRSEALPSLETRRVASESQGENQTKTHEQPHADSTPAISVIIPTYDRKHQLGRALTSVFQQTESDYEVIVVDDGSSDGTADWLEAHYPKVHCIRLAVNSGAAAARNAGIRQAKGQWIAFLDSDDRWLPHYLQTQRAALEQQPDAVLVYCNYIQMLPKQTHGTRVELKPSHPDLVQAMLLGNFIHTLSQVVVPVSTFQRVGLLNEALKVCEDRDFYLRTFRIGLPIHVPVCLVQKFWLPDSLVTQANCQTWLLDGLRLLDIFYNEPANSTYAPLRQQAESILRERVEASQRYFAQVLSV